VVVSKVGRELYEKFFRGYTRKQWGIDPSELDKAVTSRVPTRTSSSDANSASRTVSAWRNARSDPRVASRSVSPRVVIPVTPRSARKNALLHRFAGVTQSVWRGTSQ
jgi:protoporphyrinogen oxidase